MQTLSHPTRGSSPTMWPWYSSHLEGRAVSSLLMGWARGSLVSNRAWRKQRGSSASALPNYLCLEPWAAMEATSLEQPGCEEASTAGRGHRYGQRSQSSQSSQSRYRHGSARVLETAQPLGGESTPLPKLRTPDIIKQIQALPPGCPFTIPDPQDPDAY